MKITNLVPVLILFFSFSVKALNQEDLLDADDAFAGEITEINQDSIKLHFEIADKYYLYKHAFKFPNDDSSVNFAEAQIPDGDKKQDEFFGEVETYHHSIDIVIPYDNPKVRRETTFKYRYQGCAEAGVCYPPQTKTVNLTLPVPVAAVPGNNSNPFAKSGSENSLGLNNNDNWGGQMDEVLPEDQAFKFETIALNENTLSARFTLSPNVYLYKDKVILTSLTNGITIESVNFPQAQIKDDPHFGEVEIFFDQVEVEVKISRNNSAGSLQLQADFQGCVDEGICYPPASRTIEVRLSELSEKTVSESNSQNTELSEQDQISQDIKNDPWYLTVIKFFGLGILLALTPCVFPMIPILSGLILGQGDISRSKGFALSLAYVLGMAIAYTAAGVAAAMLGENIQAALQKPWIIITFSLVFVALAMSMFGYYELQLPASWQNKLSGISNKQKSGTYIGAGIMGILSAIIVGPCVAPPLAGTILYISDTGDPLLGGIALFSMSIGMGLPLLMIGASAGKWMMQSGGWMNVVKSFFGIALLAMAIWFLSRIIPGRVTLALFGILALLSSVFWFKYALKNGIKGQLIGLFFIIKLALLGIGVVEIYGAIKGHTDFMHPLTKYEFQFTKIKSYQDLQKKIQSSDRPVLLDFYADWCVECKKMEASTYSKEKVKQELQRFLVLKADVTKQDDTDKELMKQFKIIGPPATLFFVNEKLLKSSSFFGYKGPQEFIDHLQKVN